MSNPLEGLNEQEIEFVELIANEVKLNDIEMTAKFGDNLKALSANLHLRRISAEIKLARSKRKYLVDDLKLEQVVKGVPLALKTLVDIMRSGTERNRLSAAQTLLRPSIAYLEKLGGGVAGIEIVDADADGGSKEIRIVLDKQDVGL